MFDLDKEIEDWGKSLSANRCLRERLKSRNAEGIEELKDHLLCEVERLQAEGLSAEKAFEQAKEALGSREDLMSDDEDLGHRMKVASRANAVAWAMVMLAAALLLSGSDATNGRSWFLLLVVLINGWFLSHVAIQRVTRKRGGSKRYDNQA